MVVKLLNKILHTIIYKLYYYSRSYLLDHNCLVYKDDFDFVFWSDGL